MLALSQEEWQLSIFTLTLWGPPAHVCEQLAHVTLHTDLSSGADRCRPALLQE